MPLFCERSGNVPMVYRSSPAIFVSLYVFKTEFLGKTM